MNFQLKSKFSLSSDQKQAVEKLYFGLQNNYKYQTLLGATGTGKTFTIANVIQKYNKPTLVIAHNKTLAAQLCNELKQLFPNNAVEYFISYYDFYRPEAYIPKSDTYIEKSVLINDEIDRLRHSATKSLFERKDVIVVSSVSCIYGLGLPDEYLKSALKLNINDFINRKELINKLIKIHYQRNDTLIERGTFRVKGNIIEIFPSYEENFIRIELFDDEVEKISILDSTTMKCIDKKNSIVIYPAKHFLISKDYLLEIVDNIKMELKERVEFFKSKNKLIEAQRIEEKVNYDLEILLEIGYCNGIENYSRHLTKREAGKPPQTLLDYFPEDFLLVIDESHVTLPQIKAMYSGDKSRKKNLIEYGFRLPSALDNRPLKWEEFEKKISKAIFVSATPSDFEVEISNQIVEQLIRPTGLIDPEIFVRKTENQIDDLINEIRKRVSNKERILITTLTKKMAEDLTNYLENLNLKVKYLHSDIKSINRIKILNDFRNGIFDILIGVNLLREGLDLPEVSLVVILDADKEGFLRSETSLIQTIGRAARNISGQIIMYADKITSSMKKAIDETNRRRKLQIEYNKINNIIPKPIIKSLSNPILDKLKVFEENSNYQLNQEINIEDIPSVVKNLEIEMKNLAKNLEFEKAAQIRDKINALNKCFKSFSNY
jgi:excinuclease ABC subunit B